MVSTHFYIPYSEYYIVNILFPTENLQNQKKSFWTSYKDI